MFENESEVYRQLFDDCVAFAIEEHHIEDFFQNVYFILDGCKKGDKNAMERIFDLNYGNIDSMSIIICLVERVSKVEDWHSRMSYIYVADFLLSLNTQEQRKYFLRRAIEKANRFLNATIEEFKNEH